jgi:hypothetical protein
VRSADLSQRSLIYPSCCARARDGIDDGCHSAFARRFVGGRNHRLALQRFEDPREMVRTNHKTPRAHRLLAG